MKFKIRCSQIGEIMPNGKGGLSKTTQSYCQQWIKEKIYGRKKEIKSKYMTKGILMEDEAIDFVSDDFGKLLLKNEKQFENDFLIGTPDIVNPLIDIKCSWDCFTFPLFEDQSNKNYFYQLQGYMALKGEKTAKLAYVLMNTPESIITQSWYYHCKDNGYDVDDVLEYAGFKEYFDYSNIDRKLRVKYYEIKYDQSVIDDIEKRVNECQAYIDELLKSIK